MLLICKGIARRIRKHEILELVGWLYYMARSIIMGVMSQFQGNKNLERIAKELAERKGIERNEAEKLAKRLIDFEIQLCHEFLYYTRNIHYLVAV